MTYCLGIKLDAGLVFASDSRITAGIDYISTYRKLHVFQPASDRFFVVLTSGKPRHHPGTARLPATGLGPGPRAGELAFGRLRV
jgi:hypothetical protein